MRRLNEWRALIEKLTLHKNVRWELEDYMAGDDDGREVTPTLDDAEAVSSLRLPVRAVFASKEAKHAVLLDLDVPAYLIPSSTPGHSHLYIDVEATWEDYQAFLDAAVKIGVLEEGYVGACVQRGATSLRLPWIKKGQEREAVANGGVLPPKVRQTLTEEIAKADEALTQVWGDV